MARSSSVFSGEIGDRMREIQQREGRAGVPAGDDADRSYTVEIVPFYLAPIGIRGIVRYASDNSLTFGQRCYKCPLPTGKCSCFKNVPSHWLGLPQGWVPQKPE